MFAPEMIVLTVLFGFVVNYVSCEPRVLNSFAEIADNLKNGAPIQINVDIKSCATAFPKDMPKYSFTQKLGYALVSQDGLAFNRESAANGSRLQLTGPAIRMYEIDISSSGTASLQVSDINPDTRFLITSGSIACKIGSGLTPIATTDYGTALSNFSDVTQALQSGHRVTTSVDLSKCSLSHSVENIDPRATNINVFAEVLDYRFSPSGSIAFSRKFPVLSPSNQLDNAYGDIKTNPDGSTDVYYYVYSPGSPVQPVRQQWKCQMNTSIFYFKI